MPGKCPVRRPCCGVLLGGCAWPIAVCCSVEPNIVHCRATCGWRSGWRGWCPSTSTPGSGSSRPTAPRQTSRCSAGPGSTAWPPISKRARGTRSRLARKSSRVSDLQFTTLYRVPFPYRRYVARRLRVGSVMLAGAGVTVTNLDGQTDYDVSGSYGVNLFGTDFYRECIDAGVDHVRRLGPVLGPYHPVIRENVRRLREISDQDEVSFHMSGTEAVMQAVRLARFHTRRSHLVRFCGAYHGWWAMCSPGWQPATARTTYTMEEMNRTTLRVLESRGTSRRAGQSAPALHRTRRACDGTLIDSSRRAGVDRAAYAAWLGALRAVCSKRSIVLIFDEVFVGFRIALAARRSIRSARRSGHYGRRSVAACRWACSAATPLYEAIPQDRPSDVCFAAARSIPSYVMGAMYESFAARRAGLRRSYERLDETWNPGWRAESDARSRAPSREGPTWCHGPSSTPNLPGTTGCSILPARAGLSLSWMAPVASSSATTTPTTTWRRSAAGLSPRPGRCATTAGGGAPRSSPIARSGARS